MIDFCAICMVKRNDMITLGKCEGRRYLETIVSPFIPRSSLKSCKLDLCMDCHSTLMKMLKYRELVVRGFKNLIFVQNRYKTPCHRLPPVIYSHSGQIDKLLPVANQEVVDDSEVTSLPKPKEPVNLYNAEKMTKISLVSGASNNIRIKSLTDADVKAIVEPLLKKNGHQWFFKTKNLAICVQKMGTELCESQDSKFNNGLPSLSGDNHSGDSPLKLETNCANTNPNSSATVSCESDFDGPDNIPEYKQVVVNSGMNDHSYTEPTIDDPDSLKFEQVASVNDYGYPDKIDPDSRPDDWVIKNNDYDTESPYELASIMNGHGYNGTDFNSSDIVNKVIAAAKMIGQGYTNMGDMAVLVPIKKQNTTKDNIISANTNKSEEEKTKLNRQLYEAIKVASESGPLSEDIDLTQYEQDSSESELDSSHELDSKSRELFSNSPYKLIPKSLLRERLSNYTKLNPKSTHDLNLNSRYDLNTMSTHNLNPKSTHEHMRESMHELKTMLVHELTSNTSNELYLSSHELDSLLAHKLLSMSQELPSQTSHELESKTSDEVDPKTPYQLELKSSHELDSKSSHEKTPYQLELKSSHELDSKSSHELDSESTLSCCSDYEDAELFPNIMLAKVFETVLRNGDNGVSEGITTKLHEVTDPPSEWPCTSECCYDCIDDSDEDPEDARCNVNSAGRNECRLCNKTYASARHLRVHYNRQHVDVCAKKCCNSIEQTNDVTQRRLELRSPSPLRYNCQACGIHYFNNKQLQAHLVTARHALRSQWRYQCDICKKRFEDKKGIAEHIPFEHMLKEALTCPMCSATFHSARALGRHAAAHILADGPGATRHGDHAGTTRRATRARPRPPREPARSLDADSVQTNGGVRKKPRRQTQSTHNARKRKKQMPHISELSEGKKQVPRAKRRKTQAPRAKRRKTQVPHTGREMQVPHTGRKMQVPHTGREMQVPHTEVRETQVPHTKVRETQVPYIEVRETQVPHTKVRETPVPLKETRKTQATYEREKLRAELWKIKMGREIDQVWWNTLMDKVHSKRQV